MKSNSRGCKNKHLIYDDKYPDYETWLGEQDKNLIEANYHEIQKVLWTAHQVFQLDYEEM